jgi:hypothetical protein
MMPQRIQRKRTKGWKMPENTVYVGRGSKWGNPYRIKGRILLVQRFYQPEWVPYDTIERDDIKEFAVKKYEGFIRCNSKRKGRYNLDELRGKNLACWCKPGDPCHADVLLKLANQ